MHVEGEQPPARFRRPHVARIEVILHFVVLDNIDSGFVVPFVNILVNVFHSTYRCANLDVDVCLEDIDQVSVVRNNPPVIELDTAFHVTSAIVPSAIPRVFLRDDLGILRKLIRETLSANAERVTARLADLTARAVQQAGNNRIVKLPLRGVVFIG
jgi:hypothetical protein